MNKEQIALELTKMYINQINISNNSYIANKQQILAYYTYFLKELEKDVK